MRTRMCAAWASATAAFDSDLGGSTIPTRLVICRSVIQASRSPSGSKSAWAITLMAAAITRNPDPAIRSALICARSVNSVSHGTEAPAARAELARDMTAGAAPLTKHWTTSRPDGSTSAWKVAISL